MAHNPAPRAAATLAIAVIAVSGQGAAQPHDVARCEPATAAPTDLPGTWRAALDDLVRAAAEPGRPWSCSGARLSLELAAAGGATLRVVDPSGRTVTREVPAPADLVSIGEAVLARTVAEPATPETPASEPAATPRPTNAGERPPPPQRPDRAQRVPSLAPRSSSSPFLEVDGRLSGRFAGPTSALWGGARLAFDIVVDVWSVGIWARFDAPALFMETVPPDFSMSEIVLGLGLTRRLPLGPLELRLALLPALSVVTMEGGGESQLSAGNEIDMRVGAAATAAWKLSESLRVLLGVDGELVPAAIGGSDDRRIEPALPPLPAYTFGMSLGLAVELR